MADKTLKEHIVSFRIPKEQATIINDMLKKEPVVGIKSIHQFFRKLARDFIAGRMQYKNPNDRLVDKD